MENKKLQILRKSIDQLSLEAKDTFTRKFSYLKITDIECKNLLVNKVQFDMPETDGSILIGLSCKLTRPLSTIEQIIFDKSIPSRNLKIVNTFNKKITFSLDRLFYHTKKKFIFSM